MPLVAVRRARSRLRAARLLPGVAGRLCGQPSAAYGTDP